MQTAAALAGKTKVLYVSGEESAHQVAARAARLGASKADLQLVTSNSADDIAATIAGGSYQVVIVDSIQTVAASAVASARAAWRRLPTVRQLHWRPK